MSSKLFFYYDYHDYRHLNLKRAPASANLGAMYVYSMSSATWLGIISVADSFCHS